MQTMVKSVKTAKAVKVLDLKLIEGNYAAELVIWQLPARSSERPHGLKYRLWCGRAGATVVRYDNETGKGDHRHFGQREEPYAFQSIDQLIADFAADVERLCGWRIS